MQPERQTERLAKPPYPIARGRDPDPRPCHDARALTVGGNEAEIHLDGVRYVLRITRQGKLILTK